MAYMFGALSTAKLYDVNRIKDEFVDQLHYIITSMALVVCATCVCFKQFAGRPIECAVGATVEDNDGDVSVRSACAHTPYARSGWTITVGRRTLILCPGTAKYPPTSTNGGNKSYYFV
jgi:hypothetical protein